MKHEIIEAFSLIAVLARSLGVTRINNLRGCWELAIDDHWQISVNGHPVTMIDSSGDTVGPISCNVQFNGWPAGVLNPFGGLFAAGTVANEDAFIAALKRRSGTGDENEIEHRQTWNIGEIRAR